MPRNTRAYIQIAALCSARSGQPALPYSLAMISGREYGSSRGAVGSGFVAVPVCAIAVGATAIRATTHSSSRWTATHFASECKRCLRVASAVASSRVIS